MNILITSAGRRVSLVKSFITELAKIDATAKVFAADANPEYSSACRVANSYFKVVRLNHEDYISNLLGLCKANNIGLIIPTIDTELLLLSENYNRFRDVGIEVVVSDTSLVKACRDKRLTHQLFSEHQIDVAALYDKASPVFPLFIKPYDGSCSVDTYKIEHPGMLTDYHFSNEKFMFLEYLDLKEHKEFTVDLYYDRNCNLKCIVPRERIEVRSGEVNKGITRKGFLIDYLKARLVSLKGARGCITLQVFVHNITQRVIGIEINPRFGGGYPLSYLAGANFTQWVLDEYILNKELQYFDGWEANLLMLRYDDEILVHDFKS